MNMKHISHELLRNFNQIHLPSKRIQQCSIEEASGTGVIDYLVIRTFDINWKYINKHLEKKSEARNSYFDRIKIYKHKSKSYLNVRYSVKIEENLEKKARIIQDQFPYQVTLNPSKFPSGKELFLFLKKVLGESHRDRVVWRIDFSVLLPKDLFPVEFFFFHLYVPNKRKTTSFLPQIPQERSDYITSESGDFTGIQYGSYPKKLQIYDIEKYKSINKFRTYNYETFLSRFHKGRLSKHGFGTVNVEYQFAASNSKKLGIHHLHDFHKQISKIAPFTGIKLYDCFSPEAIAKNSSLSFQLNCLKLGFQHTRRRFNEGNNASRFLERHFTEIGVSKGNLPFDQFLNNAFRESVNNFLKP